MHFRFRISAGVLILSVIVFTCSAGEVKTGKQTPPTKSPRENVKKTLPKKPSKTVKKTPTEKKTNAVISVDSAHFDAGVFKQGKVKSVKHDFVIKNTGTDTLIIKKVKPG
jgi:hypothetical protein